MAFGKDVEEVPVEVVELSRQRAALHVVFLQRHRLVPEEPCGAIAEAVRYVGEQLPRLVILKAEEAVRCVVDDRHAAALLPEDDVLHLRRPPGGAVGHDLAYREKEEIRARDYPFRRAQVL